MKGDIPLLKDAPKGNPAMGKVAEGHERRQTVSKVKCPIETSIDIRKTEGDSATNIVRDSADKKADDVVFGLKLKGSVPSL